MLSRCNDPNCKGYKEYGARGIKVCDRWLNFQAFYADMGPRPSLVYSIDRINNDGNYEPENCRWATAAEQQRNRRDSKRWKINGATYETYREAAAATGIPAATLLRRVHRGEPGFSMVPLYKESD